VYFCPPLPVLIPFHLRVHVCYVDMVIAGSSLLANPKSWYEKDGICFYKISQRVQRTAYNTV